MAKSAVTAVTTASHRLLFAVSAVKCSAEFTGTTVTANPSSGAASADWSLPVNNAMQEPSTASENVVVQAINTLLGDKSTYQAELQQNIAKVIREAQKSTADGIDKQLMEL